MVALEMLVQDLSEWLCLSKRYVSVICGDEYHSLVNVALYPYSKVSLRMIVVEQYRRQAMIRYSPK